MHDSQGLTNVGRRIANGNCSISSSSDILLDVSRYGLDPFRRIAGGYIVDDFVGRKKQESVVVVLELIDGREDIL